MSSSHLTITIDGRREDIDDIISHQAKYQSTITESHRLYQEYYDKYLLSLKDNKDEEKKIRPDVPDLPYSRRSIIWQLRGTEFCSDLADTIIQTFELYYKCNMFFDNDNEDNKDKIFGGEILHDYDGGGDTKKKSKKGTRLYFGGNWLSLTVFNCVQNEHLYRIMETVNRLSGLFLKISLIAPIQLHSNLPLNGDVGDGDGDDDEDSDDDDSENSSHTSIYEPDDDDDGEGQEQKRQKDQGLVPEWLQKRQFTRSSITFASQSRSTKLTTRMATILASLIKTTNLSKGTTKNDDGTNAVNDKYNQNDKQAKHESGNRYPRSLLSPTTSLPSSSPPSSLSSSYSALPSSSSARYLKHLCLQNTTLIPQSSKIFFQGLHDDDDDDADDDDGDADDVEGDGSGNDNELNQSFTLTLNRVFFGNRSMEFATSSFLTTAKRENHHYSNQNASAQQQQQQQQTYEQADDVVVEHFCNGLRKNNDSNNNKKVRVLTTLEFETSVLTTGITNRQLERILLFGILYHSSLRVLRLSINRNDTVTYDKFACRQSNDPQKDWLASSIAHALGKLLSSSSSSSSSLLQSEVSDSTTATATTTNKPGKRISRIGHRLEELDLGGQFSMEEHRQRQQIYLRPTNTHIHNNEETIELSEDIIHPIFNAMTNDSNISNSVVGRKTTQSTSTNDDKKDSILLALDKNHDDTQSQSTTPMVPVSSSSLDEYSPSCCCLETLCLSKCRLGNKHLRYIFDHILWQASPTLSTINLSGNFITNLVESLKGTRGINIDYHRMGGGNRVKMINLHNNPLWKNLRQQRYSTSYNYDGATTTTTTTTPTFTEDDDEEEGEVEKPAHVDNEKEELGNVLIQLLTSNVYLESLGDSSCWISLHIPNQIKYEQILFLSDLNICGRYLLLQQRHHRYDGQNKATNRGVVVAETGDTKRQQQQQQEPSNRTDQFVPLSLWPQIVYRIYQRPGRVQTLRNYYRFIFSLVDDDGNNGNGNSTTRNNSHNNHCNGGYTMERANYSVVYYFLLHGPAFAGRTSLGH